MRKQLALAIIGLVAVAMSGCDLEEPEDPTPMEVQAAVCVELAKE
jgi:hypothetical protein